MKSLLWLNFKLTRRSLLFYLAAMAVFSVLPVFLPLHFTLSLVYLPAAVLGALLNTFTADEACHWDALAAALPNGRRAVVQSKYLYTALYLLAMAAVCGAIQLALRLAGLVEPSALDGSLVLLIGGMMFLLIAAALPVLFRFGSSGEGRALLVLVLILVAALWFGFSTALTSLSIGSWRGPPRADFDTGALGAFLVSILAFAASYFVSLRLYDDREF